MSQEATPSLSYSYSSPMRCLGCGNSFTVEPFPTWPCPKCASGPLLRIHLVDPGEAPG